MVGGLHGIGTCRQDFAYLHTGYVSLPLLRQIRQQMETFIGHSLYSGLLFEMISRFVSNFYLPSSSLAFL